MNIGIIIPDRGDRGIFKENWNRQLDEMTYKLILYAPFQLAYVNHKPKNGTIDITERYRIGYDRMRGLGLELIFCLEVDDFYSTDYLLIMIQQWIAAGKPDLFGVDYTYYYHVKLKKYFKYEHQGRASMMCTAIKPDLDIPWPKDNYPFTDMHLWKFMQSKKTFRPDKPIAIGMKGHGIGMAGGTGHTDRLGRYIQDDQSHAFLKEHLDSDSYNFFSKL